MPREPRITHVAFSDESHWNIGRYRALALVSMPQYSIPTLEQQVRRILQNSNILEFKWNKLGGAKERTAAIDICKAVVDAACDGNLRIASHPVFWTRV